MFAATFLLSSLVFCAFFLAFFAIVDRLTAHMGTAALALLICQDENGVRLSAFVADNQPFMVGSDDYEPSDLPGETCLFDALAMLASEIVKAEEESALSVVKVKAIGPEDIDIQRAWNSYRKYAAFAATFSPVIRSEAQYVCQESAFNAEDPVVDDGYARWACSSG